MVNILRDILGLFRVGKELADEDAEPFFDALIAETDEALLAEVLTVWEQKGTTENELFALATIMRRRCIRVNTKHRTFVDAVGTGGSKAKTFNVSTAAAFVAAGAGVPVAKHGNRAATSNSGSADALVALGVNPSVDALKAAECLDQIGICFMFAPNFHSLSATLGKVRRGLGFPTIFNNLGPLCNPANAPHQVIGVWRYDLLAKTSHVLARLGTARSWVVRGSDGLDEITLNGPTTVSEVEGSNVRTFEVSPADYGIEHSDLNGLRVSSSDDSANMIRDILSGRSVNRTAIDLVAINAAAAIAISSKLDFSSAIAEANNSIASGAAAEKLQQLSVLTNK